MAQWLKNTGAAFAEDRFNSQLTAICNPAFKRSDDALFWLPWVSGTAAVHGHAGRQKHPLA